jgi:hypothetical protein
MAERCPPMMDITRQNGPFPAGGLALKRGYVRPRPRTDGSDGSPSPVMAGLSPTSGVT